MNRPSLIVLAAGASRRFGASNKLLADVNGERLLSRTLSVYAAANFGSRILVVRGVGPVAHLGQDYGFDVVINENADNGLGTSLSVGAGACPEGGDLMIALGDMPFVKLTTVESLLIHRGRAGVIVPVCEGRDGNPKLFAARYREALKSFSGDEGARQLIRANRDDVLRVSVDDPGVLRDVDRPSDLP